MTKINKIEATKKIERKTIEELRSHYEKEEELKKINEIKDDLRKNYGSLKQEPKNLDDRPVNEILKENFVDKNEIN